MRSTSASMSVSRDTILPAASAIREHVRVARGDVGLVRAALGGLVSIAGVVGLAERQGVAADQVEARSLRRLDRAPPRDIPLVAERNADLAAGRQDLRRA